MEQTSDGRYEVEHPPLPGRMVMGAKTIRSLYPIVAAVLALALLPALAFGATPKQVRKAEATVDRQLRGGELGNIFSVKSLAEVRVACHSTSATRIACVVRSSSTTAGETFTVAGGKVHGAGLESPAPVTNTARIASIRTIRPGDLNVPDSEDRLGMAYCVAAVKTAELIEVAQPYSRITALAIHRFTPEIPYGANGLVGASEYVFNGAYVHYTAICASKTGTIFEASQTTDLNDNVLGNQNTWRNSHAHGTWTNPSQNEYVLTSA